MRCSFIPLGPVIMVGPVGYMDKRTNRFALNIAIRTMSHQKPQSSLPVHLLSTQPLPCTALSKRVPASFCLFRSQWNACFADSLDRSNRRPMLYRIDPLSSGCRVLLVIGQRSIDNSIVRLAAAWWRCDALTVAPPSERVTQRFLPVAL